jgi:molecular chaperone DnaK
MRTKIDYGIDLGTTNSAIARMENGKPVIKKTDTLKDTLPSCVSITKKQDILVGDPAFNALKADSIRALKKWDSDGPNSYIEFKRTMGTNVRYHSSNMNKEFTSEELSAEVLMKLKSLITDDSLKSIVITVPAKFTMVQKDATLKAGQLAGFEQIELLQEPIAASMAYGLDSKNMEGIWLVFDFGGGTFDAALIKVDDGIMKVVDTEGDNWLGGKNIDDAIVDQLIIPYLKDNYSLEGVLGDNGQKETLRKSVKAYAEECKIQMSFKDSYNILTDLGDLPFEDEDGDEPAIDIDVTQELLQGVVGPIFQRAIDICKDLLKRNNLKGDQLETILLVGGPTYSPILRRMLKEQISEKVNTSIDPMTSVAMGAALFASTIDILTSIVEPGRDVKKVQLELKYDSTTVEMDEMVNLKVLKDKTEGELPNKIFAEITRGDKAWSSGKKQISDKATLVDVSLVGGASNVFEIILYDEQGNQLDCQPNTFNILQGMNPGQATLPYNIAVEITDRVQGKDLLTKIKGLEKNQPLPATGVTEGLKTQKDLRPGIESDQLIIPIYQGDFHSNNTTAIHSTHINNVVITGETLPKLLPAGSDVEITIKVDRSEGMKIDVYFPYLNHTEEKEVEIIQTETVSKEWLENEIRKAKKIAKKINSDHESPEVKEIINNIDELSHKLEDKGGGEGGKLEVQDNLLKELRKLDKLEGKTEWPKLEKELKESFYELEELVEKLGEEENEDLDLSKVNGHLEDLQKRTEHAVKTKDVIEARELIKQIDQMNFALRDAASGGMMDVAFVQQINNDFAGIKWKDPSKARILVNQAIQSINAGKISNLRPVVIQVIDLMERESAEEFTGKLTR